MTQQELPANKEEQTGETDREEDIIGKQEVNEPLCMGRGEQLRKLELFAKLKQEHNLAKAVKSDDAEVPQELWNQAVCRAPPSEACWYDTDNNYGWMPGITYRTPTTMIGAKAGTPRSSKM